MGEHGENSWQDNIRNLELMAETFTEKSRFIDKVYTGTETVTMNSIDRCREVMMQLNQCAHAFELKVTNLDKNIPPHIEKSISDMRDSIKAAIIDSNSKINTILTWVPPGLTSRRTDR